MYVIYGMEDQRAHEVFYVGQTDDIQGRFLQHLRCDGTNPVKDARIQEMLKAGYLPLPRTLQTVADPEQAKKRESYWIRHFYEMGMPLTNQVIPLVYENMLIVHTDGKRNGKRRLTRIAQATETEDEIELTQAQKLKLIQVLEMDAKRAGQNDIIRSLWGCEPNTRAGGAAAEELRLIRAYIAQEQRKSIGL